MKAQSTENQVLETPKQKKAQKMIAYWLLLSSVMVFGMIVLGGVTRLTHSGLSMVEWRPLMGTFPPSTKKEWNRVFDLYKKHPEFKIKNQSMDLAGFKRIFYVEYGHRLSGRLIGFVFFLPFLFFLLTGRLSKYLLRRLLLLLLLGGLQGLLGWYMVKSGLVKMPRVSPYRLTAHFMLALLLFGMLLWTFLQIKFAQGSKPMVRLQAPKWPSYVLTSLIALMAMTGGFVAGNKAGLYFNTFPKMGSDWIPSGLFYKSPWFINFFESVVTVQFVHRTFAMFLCLIIPAFWFWSRKFELPKSIRFGINLFVFVLVIQVTLGITTLLYYVPIPLAAAHQGGAVCLFACSLFISYAWHFHSQSSPSKQA